MSPLVHRVFAKAFFGSELLNRNATLVNLLKPFTPLLHTKPSTHRITSRGTLNHKPPVNMPFTVRLQSVVAKAGSERAGSGVAEDLIREPRAASKYSRGETHR